MAAAERVVVVPSYGDGAPFAGGDREAADRLAEVARPVVDQGVGVGGHERPFGERGEAPHPRPCPAAMPAHFLLAHRRRLRTLRAVRPSLPLALLSAAALGLSACNLVFGIQAGEPPISGSCGGGGATSESPLAFLHGIATPAPYHEEVWPTAVALGPSGDMVVAGWYT